MDIKFGRDICCDIAQAESREWLVTNGLGSFASGTVAGLLTRRYHGLLVSALKPPVGRFLLVTKLDETLKYRGGEYPIFSNRWSDGSAGPAGYKNIESFTLDGSIPVWRFRVSDALLEKRLWMCQGENITFVRYSLIRGSAPLTLDLKALVNYRGYHGSTKAPDPEMDIKVVGNGIEVIAFEDASPFWILTDSGTFETTHEWYYGFKLAQESKRGLDDLDDNLHAGTFTSTLNVGQSITLALSSDEPRDFKGQIELENRVDYEWSVLEKLNKAKLKYPKSLREKIGNLALAGDQFIVKRAGNSEQEEDHNGSTIIAGYHWFGDWGRDTMISLAGLTVYSGRPEAAKSILQTFAKYADKGMLLNRFPEQGESPEYNTVDAALWYFIACKSYYDFTKDSKFLKQIYPVLQRIIERHIKGTRFNIKVDEKDGLLYAGEEGVQLTWMDAKVGGRVVTPRIGKPVEVNALWYNALFIMAEFSKKLKKESSFYSSLAEKAGDGFGRFWNDSKGYCYDVIDGPEGCDESLRPNQVFAVSLENSPLTQDRQKKVVDICSQKLLTSFGLRSLSPDDEDYKGIYTGDQGTRDGAYHQGTVWGWLLGHFALAHLKVYQNQEAALEYLEPLFQNLKSHGLGSLSEIFDGDSPHDPKGCIAQAWTVAELIRSYITISKHK